MSVGDASQEGQDQDQWFVVIWSFTPWWEQWLSPFRSSSDGSFNHKPAVYPIHIIS